MLQAGRRALSVVAVAAVATAGLVMTAAARTPSGTTTTRATSACQPPPAACGSDSTDELVIHAAGEAARSVLEPQATGTELAASGKAPIGGNTGPVGLVIPEAERNNLLALIEAGAPLASRVVTWTETDAGALISQNGSTLVVAADTNTLDGDGAVVAKLTLSGNGGTESAVRYQANGVGKFEETFTNGTPDANGVIPLTGSGKCTGGTGVHKHEKCSYTFTGTFNPKTSVVNDTVTGTTTR